MKRTIAALLALMIACCFTDAFVEEGTVTLNDGELAATAYAMFVGEGYNVPLDKIYSYDEINSRFIFIGSESLGADLVVLIRISEDTVCYWPMELTQDNLIRARLALDEEAPFCLVTAYENEILTDSAMYIKSLGALLTYESFMSDAERIMAAAADGLVPSE